MKNWLKKFCLLFWPWSKIDEIEKALAKQNDMLIAANDRYNNAYRDGYTHHLQQWMAQTNVQWGSAPFSDDEKTLLIHLYNKGFAWKDALERLAIAQAREGKWRQFTN